METSTENRHARQRGVRLSLMACLLAVSLPAIGQEQPETAPSQATTTTSDALSSVDHLQVLLRPLTKNELETELNGWLDLLRAKIREVGATELKLQSLPEGDAQLDPLTQQLLDLRTEESDLTERAQAVLDALQAKGGDVQEPQDFINAVADIGEVTDATSRWAAIVAKVKNWAGRDDGGVLMAKRIVLAFFILFVGWIVSRFAGRATARVLSRYPRASQLLENFARRTAGGVVFIVGILMALAALGVEVGPLMAALGAGGFIVGFALQETLGSFASGLMIMVYQPFDVDDYVAVAGVEGTVKAMSLVSTTLLTIDNKVLVIPNKKAWGDTITNFTGKELRRVDLVFGIGYEDDISHAMDVLKQIIDEHELILDEPDTNIQVDALADSSVNLLCRPWVKTGDYWTVHWDLLRQVKERFDAEGISIPFPQRDVHIHTPSASPDQA